MRVPLVYCLAAAAVAIPILAQEPTIKVDVNLVNLLFTVRNKAGGLVGSLEKNNFTLFEDGKQQEIKYFTRETDLPLTLGLLVDVSASQERMIDDERRAASQFFAEVLRKKDMAYLISFGAEAELLQDSTESPKLLQSALNELRLNVQVGGLHPGPVPTMSQPKGTILYDAVYLAANEKMKGEVGRKAIVIITDGVDQGSRYKVETAIEAAQKTDSIIYSIEYYDPRAYGGGFMIGGSGGEGVLRRMSEETGGHMYRVDRNHSLHEIFQQLQDELRSQYSLAYTPTNGKRDGTFRRIEIRADNKEYKVQTRKGYYATEGEGN